MLFDLSLESLEELDEDNKLHDDLHDLLLFTPLEDGELSLSVDEDFNDCAGLAGAFFKTGGIFFP